MLLCLLYFSFLLHIHIHIRWHSTTKSEILHTYVHMYVHVETEMYLIRPALWSRRAFISLVNSVRDATCSRRPPAWDSKSDTYEGGGSD